MDTVCREYTKGVTGILNTENRSGETKQYTRMTIEWVSWEAQIFFSLALHEALFSYVVKRHLLSAMRKQSHSWIPTEEMVQAV